MVNIGKAGDTLIGIILAVIGVAILAVIVSQKSDTAQVLKDAGGAFAGILKSAFGSVQG
jgi:Tfp pilus assembly protein PilE